MRFLCRPYPHTCTVLNGVLQIAGKGELPCWLSVPRRPPGEGSNGQSPSLCGTSPKQNAGGEGQLVSGGDFSPPSHHSAHLSSCSLLNGFLQPLPPGVDCGLCKLSVGYNFISVFSPSSLLTLVLQFQFSEKKVDFARKEG